MSKIWSTFDLVLLNLGLIGKDGWTVLQELSTQVSRYFAVIIVTACDEVFNRIKGFQCGVQKYIIKPFRFSDLLAQVNAQLAVDAR